MAQAALWRDEITEGYWKAQHSLRFRVDQRRVDALYFIPPSAFGLLREPVASVLKHGENTILHALQSETIIPGLIVFRSRLSSRSRSRPVDPNYGRTADQSAYPEGLQA